MRELTHLYEHEKEAWAKDMKEFLLIAKKIVEKHLDEGNLPQGQLETLVEEYKEIVLKGLLYHSYLPPLLQSKKGWEI